MIEPVLIGIEDPLTPGETIQITRKPPLKPRGIERAPQHFGLGGKAPCLPFDPADDFEKLLLIEALEVDILLITEFPPTAQVQPLKMGDGDRAALLRNLLDQNRIDLAEMLERHGHLVTANARVAGGMDGKKRNRQLRIVNATGDGPFPIVPRADLLVIDPDLVPPVFQVRLEPIHQFTVRIVTIGEENALRSVRLGGGV